MADPTLYFVRHGQTDWNAEFRFQGRKNIPLNANGQMQADKNGLKLARLIGSGEGLDFISSPLDRARETMERLRKGLDLPPGDYQIDERLIEVSFGDLEGTTLADLKANNNALHRYRKANAWHFLPQNGESADMALGRVSEWYNSLQNDCVVAAHGVIGRIIRFYLLDLDHQEAARFVFPQDKVCVICKGREQFY